MISTFNTTLFSAHLSSAVLLAGSSPSVPELMRGLNSEDLLNRYQSAATLRDIKAPELAEVQHLASQQIMRWTRGATTETPDALLAALQDIPADLPSSAAETPTHITPEISKQAVALFHENPTFNETLQDKHQQAQLEAIRKILLSTDKPDIRQPKAALLTFRYGDNLATTETTQWLSLSEAIFGRAIPIQELQQLFHLDIQRHHTRAVEITVNEAGIHITGHFENTDAVFIGSFSMTLPTKPKAADSWVCTINHIHMTPGYQTSIHTLDHDSAGAERHFIQKLASWLASFGVDYIYANMMTPSDRWLLTQGFDFADTTVRQLTVIRFSEYLRQQGQTLTPDQQQALLSIDSLGELHHFTNDGIPWGEQFFEHLLAMEQPLYTRFDLATDSDSWPQLMIPNQWHHFEPDRLATLYDHIIWFGKLGRAFAGPSDNAFVLLERLRNNSAIMSLMSQAHNLDLLDGRPDELINSLTDCAATLKILLQDTPTDPLLAWELWEQQTPRVYHAIGHSINLLLQWEQQSDDNQLTLSPSAQWLVQHRALLTESYKAIAYWHQATPALKAALFNHAKQSQYTHPLLLSPKAMGEFLADFSRSILLNTESNDRLVSDFLTWLHDMEIEHDWTYDWYWHFLSDTDRQHFIKTATRLKKQTGIVPKEFSAAMHQSLQKAVTTADPWFFIALSSNLLAQLNQQLQQFDHGDRDTFDMTAFAFNHFLNNQIAACVTNLDVVREGDIENESELQQLMIDLNKLIPTAGELLLLASTLQTERPETYRQIQQRKRRLSNMAQLFVQRLPIWHQLQAQRPDLTSNPQKFTEEEIEQISQLI